MSVMMSQIRTIAVCLRPVGRQEEQTDLRLFRTKCATRLRYASLSTGITIRLIFLSSVSSKVPRFAKCS